MCFLSFFISSVIYWSDSGLHSVSWVWLGSPGLVVQTVFSQLQFSHVHVLKWVTVQLLHLNSWVIVLKTCWGQHLEGWHWSKECEWRTHWVWSKECNWLVWRLGKVQRVAENKALFGGKTDRTFMDIFVPRWGVDFPAPQTDWTDSLSLKTFLPVSSFWVDHRSILQIFLLISVRRKLWTDSSSDFTFSQSGRFLGFFPHR